VANSENKLDKNIFNDPDAGIINSTPHLPQ
jgi:hypothetical protein